jgi:O-acetyl-ADP-ribose deacetylase (regulator of RNase III)
MPLTLLKQDITRMETDVIVNAANTDLVMGGGVCGAIFRAAGPDKLQTACNALSPIATGDAVITPGFALPAKYIIHTAGPIYRRAQAELCRAQLRSCYLNSLTLAEAKGCASIAFPLISSGIYGYPREDALQVAQETIREYLKEHDMEGFLLLLDKGPGLVDTALMARVRAYVDSLLPSAAPDHRILQSMRAERFGTGRAKAAKPAPVREEAECFDLAMPDAANSLEHMVGHLDESFSQTLLRLIDAKGRTDVDVYKRANIDRKLFSKIRTGKGYMPSKRTALALAVSLELNLGETEDLLSRAGYTLSHSQKADVIVEYCILNKIYDIYLINEALFQYDQPLLGS